MSPTVSRLARSLSPVLTLLGALGALGVYFSGEIRQARAEGAEKAATLERRMDDRDAAYREQVRQMREEFSRRTEMLDHKVERVEGKIDEVLKELRKR